MNEPVEIGQSGQVMTIRMNRMDKKNAITAAMYASMAEALARSGTDTSVRAVLFLGGDNCFTAGNDLKDFLENPPHEEGAPVFRFLRALLYAAKPLIAAVDGIAVGIGTTMLLHCDLVLVTERTRLQMPFVNLALLPEAGSTYLLPKMLGHAKAAELVMLGEPIAGADAVALGLANRMVAPDALEATALEIARALAAKAPEALRLTKALLKHDRGEIEAAMEREAKEFARRLTSAEAREVFSAFLDKRKPDFSNL